MTVDSGAEWDMDDAVPINMSGKVTGMMLEYAGCKRVSGNGGTGVSQAGRSHKSGPMDAFTFLLCAS